MTEIDLTAWCRQNAEDYREYEHINMAVPPTSEDRDTAVVEWTVRVLGNPDLAESREVLRLLADRHGLDEHCDYGCPLGGSLPRVNWCGLERGHAGLHFGGDDRVGFTNGGTVRRGAR